MDKFLSILDEKLPLCKEEREDLLRQHNRSFAQHARTVNSLHRKFATLHRKKRPTGDPLIPDDVHIYATG